jgi:hypothetical protein
VFDFIDANIRHVRRANRILEKYYDNPHHEKTEKAQMVFEKIADKLEVTPQTLINVCGCYLAYQIMYEGLGQKKGGMKYA